MGWKVTANDIKNSTATNKRSVEEILPLLVKKLIFSTTKTVYINIPSGDSVAIGGLDGFVEVVEGNAFIPDGKVIFEFGTNTDTNKKANEDYQKRTDDSTILDKEEITFIFATTQTWAKKHQFETEKNRENIWKNVRGINADDLENWLENSPATHRWFARFIGKRPEGALDVEQAFEKWSKQTKINLPPTLVLEGRSEEKEQLFTKLSATPSEIIISSQSELESYAFIICALRDSLDYSSKSLIVQNQTEWDNLIDSKHSLILIPKNFMPDSIGVAISRGHTVILPEENCKDKNQVIHLTKIRKSQKISIFESIGFDHNEAWRIYEESKGYLHAIIKHPLLKPYGITPPQWLEDYDVTILSTILFIDSWIANNENDKKIVEKLSNISYDDFEQKLYRLKTEKEAPIRLIGKTWQVISKIHLWDVIADKIPETQFKKLEEIAFDVFTEIDPKFHIAPQDRWAAYERKMRYSDSLRESLADTLAMISAFYGEKIATRQWIEKIFNSNLHAEAWYSYHSSMRLLAESCPDCFLDAIKKALEGLPETQLEKLFDDGGSMGGCYHCDLLWTLQTLAWNQDCVMSVVDILAGLCSFEIKSKMANQPFGDLTDIFCGWINKTCITNQEKIQILESHLIKKYPELAWKLLIALLPSYGAISSDSSKPKYKNWDENCSKEVLQSDYIEYVNNINRLLLQFIKEKEVDWFEIFDNIENFDPDVFMQILDIFMELDKNSFEPYAQYALAVKLRKEIHTNRMHPKRINRLEDKLIKQLEKAFYFIEPSSVLYKYMYLFDSHEALELRPKVYDEKIDYEEERKNFESLRLQAMAEIIKNCSLDEIEKLVRSVQYPGYIGSALAQIDYTKSEKMVEWLEEENSLLICAKNFFSTLFGQKKLALEAIITKNLSDKQMSELLLASSFDAAVFTILQKSNKNIQNLYWKNLPHWFSIVEKDFGWVDWILEQFLIFSYPMKGLDFFTHIRYSTKNLSIDFNLEVIGNLLIELLINKNNEHIDQHDIFETILFLQEKNYDREKMILLEWYYSRMHGVHPKAIEKECAENPDFFVDLVSWIYKPKNSECVNEDLTQEQLEIRADNARHVLKKIIYIPGTNGKNIDYDVLHKWILAVRGKFKEVDRIEIGDEKIGELLSYSPEGSDNIWPHETVRDILEEFYNQNISDGFQIGKSNQRGFTSRSYDEGGDQEYALSAKYKQDSEVLKFLHPNTSRILKEIGEDYLYKAKWEDDRQEVER